MPRNQNQRDSFGQYLNEIGRHNLLTPDQEISLGNAIQAGLRSEQKEFEHLSDIDRQLILKGQRAKKRMVEANLRLVVSVARRYQGRGVAIEDLIQEGSIGLVRAAEKFDPTKGYRFSTYAHWWIRQGMTRYLSNQARLIRLPVHLYEKMAAVKSAARSLRVELGRKPTLEELASKLEITIEQLELIRVPFQPVVSLNLKVGETDELQMFAAAVDNPWEDTIASQAKEQLNQLIDTFLNDREADFIRSYYGLNDEPRTLTAIGQQYGLSRERARQIHVTAIKKLSRSSAKLRTN